jgi:hypothetical protein
MYMGIHQRFDEAESPSSLLSTLWSAGRHLVEWGGSVEISTPPSAKSARFSVMEGLLVENQEARARIAYLERALRTPTTPAVSTTLAGLVSPPQDYPQWTEAQWAAMRDSVDSLGAEYKGDKTDGEGATTDGEEAERAELDTEGEWWLAAPSPLRVGTSLDNFKNKRATSQAHSNSDSDDEAMEWQGAPYFH